MKLKHLIILSAIAALIVSAGCSTTSRIPDDEVLYTGLKGLDVAKDSVKFPAGVKSVLREAVNVPATPKLMHILPMGLWVYNHWDVNDSTSGLKRKLYNKFVEEPVLVSEVRPALRVKMLDEILDNNGYFHGTAGYQLVQGKNKKKASILYTINPGLPFLIDSIIYLPDTSEINKLINRYALRDKYLHVGNRYSLDSLSVVRTRITNRLKNQGYYFFRPEYIEYMADSVMHPGSIVLKLDLAKNAPAFGTTQYHVGTVTVHAYRHQGNGTPDTIHLDDGITLIQMKPSRLRQSVVSENVLMKPGSLLTMRNVNNTQSYLSRLGIFNGINVETVPDTAAKSPTVNVNVSTTFDMPLEAQIEVNASSKSNSYIGPGLIFTVTNHNVFGGGEQLSASLFGSYEWQTGAGSRSIFNSYEFGINGSLAFPRLLAPKFIPRRHRQLNWTKIKLGAELLNRPHFFKLAQFNTGITYEWQATRHVTNSLTLFNLTYNKLINTTAKFDSIMIANPAVGLSFASQFIPQMSYTYTYNRDFRNGNTLNWTFTVSEAGNIFWSIYELCGKKGDKTMFGTPFSQFVKGQTQVVWGHRLTENNTWLVSRVAVGAAHAYGNSSTVPYSEQFYCGGANSVRAFTVRSIGPGSYHQPYTKGDYFDQTGTFKFEANVEYRFPIFGPVNGAVFFDAGNVWLLKEDPARPGGVLRGRTFFKDIATGTGVGIRFDIGMLVLRGDLGIGIHAPYDTGKSGYYNMTSFGNSLAFHLAIGYPF